MLKLNKKGKGDGVMWIAVILIGALALQQFGLINLGSTAGDGTPSGQVAGAIANSCGTPSGTLTLGPLKSKWNPSTSMSTINVRYFNSGQVAGAFGSVNDFGNKLDQSTVTATNKDKVLVINGFGSTAYYSQKQEFEMPCGDASSASQDGGANELIANGSATFTINNGDTGNINAGTGADNETINTGDTGRFVFSAVNTLDKTGLSPHGKIHVIVELNGSAYQEEKTIFSGLEKSLFTPQFYTLSNTDSKTVTFLANGCPTGPVARSCNENWGTLSVVAETTADPVNAGLASSVSSNAVKVGNGWIKVSLYDEDWDVNTVTGAPLFGVQKDDGTRAGLFGTDSQIAFLSVA